MAPKCDRCDKISVSGIYRSDSTIEVQKRAADRIGLRIGTRNPEGKRIQSCISCISPNSRPVLHKRNVFERYEYTAINGILQRVGGDANIKTIDANTANQDKTRYDLLLTDTTGVKNSGSFAILIEIDEKQHFTKTGWFDGILREMVFDKLYPDVKRYILRVRTSENSPESCFLKSGKNVAVNDCKKFDNNMKSIEVHLRSILDKKPKNLNHYYIDLSKNDGVVKVDENKIEYSGGETGFKESITTWEKRIKDNDKRKKAKDNDAIANYVSKTDIKSMVKKANDKFSKLDVPKTTKTTPKTKK